jgi:hypothetical protein
MSTGTYVASGRPSGDWRTGLARAGLVAKGVLYITLGVLALQLAFGSGGGEQASQTGAIQRLSEAPFGSVLVALLAAGLLCHGVWQLVNTLTGDPVEGGEAAKRVKYGVKTVIYLGLGGLAVSVVAGGSSAGGSGGGGGTDRAASTLLGLPGGVWIVGAVGVVIVLVGLYELVRHAAQAQFMERINRTSDGHVRRHVRQAGRAGYAALGIVSLITGGFFVLAAVRHDPQESKGMSEALQTLAEQPWGPWLLTGVAAGLVLYGVFALAEARYRRAG